MIVQNSHESMSESVNPSAQEGSTRRRGHAPAPVVDPSLLSTDHDMFRTAESVKELVADAEFLARLDDAIYGPDIMASVAGCSTDPVSELIAASDPHQDAEDSTSENSSNEDGCYFEDTSGEDVTLAGYRRSFDKKGKSTEDNLAGETEATDRAIESFHDDKELLKDILFQIRGYFSDLENGKTSDQTRLVAHMSKSYKKAFRLHKARKQRVLIHPSLATVQAAALISDALLDDATKRKRDNLKRSKFVKFAAYHGTSSSPNPSMPAGSTNAAESSTSAAQAQPATNPGGRPSRKERFRKLRDDLQKVEADLKDCRADNTTLRQEHTTLLGSVSRLATSVRGIRSGELNRLSAQLVALTNRMNAERDVLPSNRSPNQADLFALQVNRARREMQDVAGPHWNSNLAGHFFPPDDDIVPFFPGPRRRPAEDVFSVFPRVVDPLMFPLFPAALNRPVFVAPPAYPGPPAQPADPAQPTAQNPSTGQILPWAESSETQ